MPPIAKPRDLKPFKEGMKQFFRFALAAVGALYWFLQRTDLGRAIKATSQNKIGARIQGVRPSMIYAVTFGLGAAITAISGSLISLSFSVFPSMGGDYLLFSFFIVVLGGLGSIKGSFVGAYILGFAEALVVFLIPMGAYLKGSVALSIMILVLLIRPEGLFGIAFEEER
jgi:branched-chain amino acid transport system permease protein